MISRVALVPQAPLLVPELVGSSPRDSEPVRDACLRAVGSLAEVTRDWVAVGVAPTATTVDASACGSFRPYGSDVAVALSERADEPPARLPLPALIAGWLRGSAGARSVRVDVIASTASPSQCRDIAARLATSAGETGLLVLGDGSNRRGARAPGGHDERAEPFDELVAAALATADTGALADLDVPSAEQLGVTGRAAWQVLAALAGSADRWRPELLYSDAPFGVGYHVAVWDRV